MDLKSFSKRIIPIQSRLYRIARMYLPVIQDAEDMVQDTFLKLWNRRHDLDRYESLEALAVQTVRNGCLDKIKSHGYSKTISGDAVMERTETGQTPHQEIENNNNQELIRRLISKLPEPQRLIIHLRDVEEYSFEEIESVTQLEINNIRVILSRARKKIKEEYLKYHRYGTRD